MKQNKSLQTECKTSILKILKVKHERQRMAIYILVVQQFFVYKFISQRYIIYIYIYIYIYNTNFFVSPPYFILVESCYQSASVVIVQTSILDDNMCRCGRDISVLLLKFECFPHIYLFQVPWVLKVSHVSLLETEYEQKNIVSPGRLVSQKKNITKQ